MEKREDETNKAQARSVVVSQYSSHAADAESHVEPHGEPDAESDAESDAETKTDEKRCEILSDRNLLP